jgi:hypothetical protein
MPSTRCGTGSPSTRISLPSTYPASGIPRVATRSWRRAPWGSSSSGWPTCFGLENSHALGPDIGTGALLLAAADNPGPLRSMVVGSGGGSFPLELVGILNNWVVAPDVEGYRAADPRESSPPPQHFRGNLDSWDPALVDRIAQEREVILLDNRGVGASTGAVPDNVSDMARDVLRFVEALGLRKIDVLGFSLGGNVAHELALVRPRLIRRLVLAGTAPQGAPTIHRWTDDVYALATQDPFDPDRFIRLFFSSSEESRGKGMEFLGRISARTVDPDEPTDLATRHAQLEAITRWGFRIRRSSPASGRSSSRHWSRTGTTTR